MANLTAKDLRIGNKVYSSQVIMRDAPPPSPFTISSISTSGIAGRFVQFEETGQHPIAIESLYGIHLTTSILEAAGFIHCGDESENQDYFSLPLKASFGHWNLLLWVLDGKYVLDCYSTAVIIYVHQLQNLYHSLTGEELTLNLNQLQQA